MTIRRISSRRVVLTATFLTLAAGGTAACDDPSPIEETRYTGPGETYVYEESDEYEPDYEPVEEDDEVFYCADEDGEIVAAENCADEASAGGLFFLWHSTNFARGLRPGDRLDGDGDRIEPGDRAARKAYKLPATGRVSNGTVKTNVVGSGSSGSSFSGSGSTSGG
ncbi:hypothetical protein [Actinoplanes sp. G11-F43]|uniref:hypothetical protein n=1 Tax=Actinoplanes sp. G11-F43 TaxID=3424130 RepID=UPI003D33AB7F